MKTKDRLFIEKSKYPTDKETHVLWHETQSLSGYGFKGIFKGTYKECLERKEKLEKKTKVRKRGILAWI